MVLKLTGIGERNTILFMKIAKVESLENGGT
jgi:hypothetical protein